jgi:5-hydroxyisourate hydrolase-like protein (transthyretin family)
MGGLSLLCSKVPRYAPARLTLTFHLADYFRSRGVSLPQPAFVERATIQIGIAHPDQHYHVPLPTGEVSVGRTHCGIHKIQRRIATALRWN